MAFLLYLLLLTPISAAEADGAFTVETLSGRVVEGELLRIEGSTLEVRTGLSRDQQVGLDELLLLTGPAVAVPDPEEPLDLLVLAGGPDGEGDRLWGRLAGGSAYGVSFSVEGSGPVEIPFERIERLLPRVRRPVDQLSRLEGAGLDDRVWRPLADGGLDGVTGVVERVEPGRVVLESSLGPIDFPVDEILAVVFGATEGPAGELQGSPVIVRLRNGSLLHAGLLQLRAGRLVLQTHFSDWLELPLETVSSVVSRGADVALLADLPPVEVEEWPSIGTPEDVLFPWRRDLSVTGRVLTVGGVPRASGLGVHAHSRMVWELPAGADRLRVGIGLVDEVAALPARGTVTFEIRVDGELRARSGVVSEGEMPRVLRVDNLRGGQRLELLVGDAGDYDAGDRAAWFDGVVMLGGRKP